MLTTTGKPALGYQKLARYRHRDAFEREWVGDYDDRECSRNDRSTKANQRRLHLLMGRQSIQAGRSSHRRYL